MKNSTNQINNYNFEFIATIDGQEENFVIEKGVVNKLKLFRYCYYIETQYYQGFGKCDSHIKIFLKENNTMVAELATIYNENDYIVNQTNHFIKNIKINWNK